MRKRKKILSVAKKNSGGQGAQRPQRSEATGLAMCRGGRRPDRAKKLCFFAKGRANSEPQNVAPQGVAAAEAPKNKNSLCQDKAFGQKKGG